MDGGRGRGGVVAAVVPFRQGRSRNRLRAGIKVAHRGMKRLTPGDSVNLVIDEHGNSGRGQQSSATRERRLKRGRRGRRRKKGGKKEEKKKGVEGGEKKNGRRDKARDGRGWKKEGGKRAGGKRGGECKVG